ncbi:MAG: hypothetical protein KGJ60_07160 [Verrucomicrobiota bacterium]|nr:hypothetical protein [Verrucomicrobiota bacterium]
MIFLDFPGKWLSLYPIGQCPAPKQFPKNDFLGQAPSRSISGRHRRAGAIAGVAIFAWQQRLVIGQPLHAKGEKGNKRL